MYNLESTIQQYDLQVDLDQTDLDGYILATTVHFEEPTVELLCELISSQIDAYVYWGYPYEDNYYKVIFVPDECFEAALPLLSTNIITFLSYGAFACPIVDTLPS